MIFKGCHFSIQKENDRTFYVPFKLVINLHGKNLKQALELKIFLL